jgi:arylsulfatase A-like enzyme
VNSTPNISIDLYPTLCEVAGAKLPADYPLDGVSYAKLLTGEQKSLDQEDLFWHFPGYLGAGKGKWRTTPVGSIRSGDWKLLEWFEDGRQELYNVKDDVSEEHNLLGKNADKAKDLHDKLVAWRASIGAKMPTPYTPSAGNAEKPIAKKQGRNKRRSADD